ncbi:hypothetical protein KGQ71_01950 [Patescibacteria group bacterium]|nr:hypothetical protein [Patescibacteria group bacterium]
MIKGRKSSVALVIKFIGVLSLFFLVVSYTVDLAFRYPSAPGGDLYNHYLFIVDLQKYGLSHFFTSYPRLFHLIVLLGMKVTDLPALKVMLYLVPIVLLGVALAAAWVAYLLAGEWAALLAFLILLFVSGQPLQTLYDGGFPNVIAAGIWLPLWVGSTSLYLSHRNWKWLGASLLFALLTLATHHFSLAYLLVLFLLLVLRYGWRQWYYWLALILIGGALIWTPLGQPFKAILNGVASFGGAFPWIHLVGKLANSDAIWRYADYAVGIGSLQVYLGLAGLIVLAIWMSSRKKDSVLPYLVFCWIVLLLIGSRIEALGFPVRVARDAGVPLAISAAVFIMVLWRMCKSLAARVGIVALCIALTLPQTIGRFYRLLHYEPTMQYTTADQEAVDRTGDAPTVVLNQLLPTTIRSSITTVNPMIHTAVGQENLRTDLADAEYVFFDIPNGDPDDYSRWLESNGFQLLVIYGDPLKTVHLFQRK